MSLPLDKITVLDFGQVGACPVTGVILANLGADVIKIERVTGESMRQGIPEGIPWRPETETGVDDTVWMACNQGKRGLAIDLRQEEGKRVINELLKKSDVVIHNFRPGVMTRMGFGYEAISKVNPKIIMLSLYPYGETGPMRNWAGGDAWIQGFGGVVALQGPKDGGPYLAGPGVSDFSGTAWGVITVLSALIARERMGISQEGVTTLFGATMYLQLPEFTDYLVAGNLNKKVGRGYRGSFPYGAYKAKDGDVVTFYGAGESWPLFCRILGLEHLLKDPMYDTQEKREQMREDLYPILDEAFSKKTRAEWQRIFRENKLRVDPALDHAEVVAHPQTSANDAIV
ncbi:MAG: CoA transferase, partial [Deltaproteobacteria bacterium]|nr:CoA transferase [Deltaproteobacteria bacterium]